MPFTPRCSCGAPRAKQPELAERGIDTALFYVKHLTDTGGVFREKWMESLVGRIDDPVDAAVLAWQVDGKATYTRMAESI